LRYDQQRVAGNQHDGGDLAPPRDVPGVTRNCAFGDREPILRFDRADRQRACWCLDPADGAYPAAEHSFGQRDRGGMIASGAQYRCRFDHTGSALDENVGVARLFDRSPQPVGPGAAFGIGRDLGCDEVAEEPHRALVEDRIRHLSVSLNATRGRGR
jgi:hypothetical protein